MFNVLYADEHRQMQMHESRCGHKPTQQANVNAHRRMQLHTDANGHRQMNAE